MVSTLAGQWAGKIDKTEYFLCIEIDDLGDHVEGRATLYEENSPIVVATRFLTSSRENVLNSHVRLEYQRISNTTPLPINQLRKEFPDGSWQESVELALRLTRKGLHVSVSLQGKSGEKVSRNALLPRSGSSTSSRLKADRSVRSWEKFKAIVGSVPMDRYIFRGQPVLKRLRTSFHRTARKDLERYVNLDIPRLHRTLAPNMNRLFDLNDANQNAAFWNLLQHHGYPTPLLDWSHSPYVAAYFAFRSALPPSEDGGNVRIFMFDARSWKSDFEQLSSVVNVRPHFSLLEPIALENPRAMPQQALSAIATVDDIEGYLSDRGAEQSKNYLRVFDLPYASRRLVLRELRLMGITAGSLFPGLDGACEAMRHVMFEDL